MFVPAILDIAALCGRSEPAVTVEKKEEEEGGIITTDPSHASGGVERMAYGSPERSVGLPTELETTLNALLWQAYESALHPDVLQLHRKAQAAAGVPVVGTTIDQTQALLQNRDPAMACVLVTCSSFARPFSLGKLGEK